MPDPHPTQEPLWTPLRAELQRVYDAKRHPLSSRIPLLTELVEAVNRREGESSLSDVLRWVATRRGDDLNAAEKQAVVVLLNAHDEAPMTKTMRRTIAARCLDSRLSGDALRKRMEGGQLLTDVWFDRVAGRLLFAFDEFGVKVAFSARPAHTWVGATAQAQEGQSASLPLNVPRILHRVVPGPHYFVGLDESGYPMLSSDVSRPERLRDVETLIWGGSGPYRLSKN